MLEALLFLQAHCIVCFYEEGGEEMELVGIKVMHQGFGEGEIVETFENKMKVQFKAGEKLFIYPGAFERFLSVKDKKLTQYLQQEIAEQKDVQEAERERRHQLFEEEQHAQKKKSITNSHAVFAIAPEDMDEIYQNWVATTGVFQSGKEKGKARVPKNLSGHSICVLTSKHADEEEGRRFITGVFMPEEDFLGDKCIDGKIKAHEQHRIRWGGDHERIYLWDYFAKEERLVKWGGVPTKYVTKQLGEKILSDMMSFAIDDSEREKVKSFYSYYCDQNNV